MLRSTGQTLLWIVCLTALWFVPTWADADLDITKADALDPVQVGQVLVYTLTVTNNGPDQAADVTVEDTLPADVNFTDARATQGSCFLTPSGTVECNLSDVADGDSVTIEIELNPTRPGTIANTATVSTPTTDPDATNNAVSENTEVIAADFRALKRVKRTVQDPVVRYEVELINDGNLDQPDNPGNEYVDPLPEAVDIVPHTLSASSGTIAYDAANDRMTWNGEIPANDRVMLEFAVGTDTGLIVAASSPQRRPHNGFAGIGLALLGTLVATRRRRLAILVALMVVSMGLVGCSGFWTAPASPDSPTSLCNQGELRFDANADGTNNGVQPTDDPTTSDPQDPTCVIFIP